MKCLIVDDEVNVRRSYVMMGRWGALGIECVLEASNGQCALDVIQRERPELVITDMYMNVMDGARFLEQLCALDYHPQIVVISGYTDYEYMHSAIKSQVIDYILKPVSEAAFNQCLEKAIDRHYSQTLGSPGTLENFVRSAQSRLLRQGGLSGGLIRLKVVSEFSARYARVLLFAPLFLNFAKVCETSARGLSDLLCVKIQQCFEAAMRRHYAGRLMLLRVKDETDWNFIGFIGYEEAGEPNPDELERLLNQAHAQLSRLGFDALIAFDPACRTWQEAESAYGRLQGALLDADIEKSARVFSLKGAARKLSFRPLDAVRSGVEQLIAENQPARAEAVLAPAYLGLRDDGLFCARQLLQIALEVFEAVSDMTSRYVSLPQNAVRLNRVWSALYDNLADVQAQKRILSELIAQVCGLLDAQAESDGPIGEILSYIDEHYAEKLSLSSLSARFFISREHLCRLIKRKTGRTYTEHLTACRLSHVCHLLRTTNMPVVEIARKSGFSDPAYMNRVFRKAYGTSPNALRAGAAQKQAPGPQA